MRCAVSAALILLSFAAPAAAQQKDPLPIFAADLRGIFARHKTEPSVATSLGVETGNLPTRSFGLVGGGVYVRAAEDLLRPGGTVLFGGGGAALDLTGSEGGDAKSPTVQRHFRSVTPEISLNFGHRNGWSYISGGFFGQSRLYLDREDAPATGAPLRKTLTYGAGARWFTTNHLAFSVDVRWYSVAEMQPPAGSTAVPEPRTTLLVLSAGISLK
jgi:hypothetical protein